MTIAVVGIGLIGGSMALVLREKPAVTKIIGVDASLGHQQTALDLNLVDEILPLEDAVTQADVVVLSTPVNETANLLPQVLDIVDQQIVFDVGSTKTAVLQAVMNHPKRGRFVATHPMWGTEYSGPQAAVREAFTGKATVVCDKENSDAAAVEIVESIYRQMCMHLVYMSAADHDLHVAYVSHISHITSFALANTVLEKEKEEETIFELASGGFESTVRLAKSNPSMWVPVFKENKENVLDVLNEHIAQLRKFKACLEKENWAYLQVLIEGANGIKRIIK